VWDWLNEYNTTSPAQAIGRGSFNTKAQITPSSSRNGSTITDANIQAELAAQINSGALPAPDNNAIYMIHFPAGKTITQGGSNSCQSGGFCAYHGTFKIGSQNVYYGVLPDMTGGCATGCGGAPTTFQNQTSVASHELIEAVTDAEVGLATVLGPPLAWYDNNNGEIGDICNGQQGTFVGNDGITYTMQQEFSNQQSDCITTRSVSTTPDFTVAVTPSSATVQPGASATYTVKTTAVNGSTQAITLTVSGLPTGVSATISPSSVNAGGSATMTVTAASTAPAATATLSVKGTAGTTTHSATASLTVGQSTGGTITLTNGVGLGSQSGAKGQQTNYVIAVPAGQASLKVTISGGTGDADLYVKFGAAPTLSTFDCRPFINGNSETCTFTNPAAGNWFIMLNGFAAYSGVTVTATFAADTTTALSNNVPVTGLAGASGSQTFFKITVPAGQTQLVVHTSGGTGDVDLYVRKGSKPTTSTFDCRPFINGNNETCTITNPAAADYFIMLRGFASYSGVSLVAHFP
jgi:serine protease